MTSTTSIAPSRAVSALHDWFFAEQPMHVFVLVRLILGFTLFAAYVERLPEFALLYSASSVAWFGPFRDLFQEPEGGIAGFVAKPLVGVLARMAEPDRRVVLTILYGALLLASIAFAAGVFTRSAGLTAVSLHLLFARINPLVYWSWGAILVPFVFYTLLSPAGRYFSLGALIRSRWRGAPLPSPDSWLGPAWPLRLLQVQVCTMYFVAGFARIDHPGWRRGHMLFEALSFSLYSRLPINWVPLETPLWLLNHFVFVLEPLAPFLLWVPVVGTVWALLLIAVHVGLELVTGVGWWNFVMIAGLLAFLPPRWLAALFEREPSGVRSGNG